MLSCPLCGRAFRDASRLKVHARKRHFLNGYCPICDRKFSSDQSLLIHFAKARDERHLALYYLARRSGKGRTPESCKRGFELIRGGLRL